MGTFTCTTCGSEADRLEEFPGSTCLACWARQEESKPLPTAAALTALWTSPKMLKGK